MLEIRLASNNPTETRKNSTLHLRWRNTWKQIILECNQPIFWHKWLKNCKKQQCNENRIRHKSYLFALLVVCSLSSFFFSSDLLDTNWFTNIQKFIIQKKAFSWNQWLCLLLCTRFIVYWHLQTIEKKAKLKLYPTPPLVLK